MSNILKEKEKLNRELKQKMDRQCDIYGVCSKSSECPPSHKVTEFGLRCLSEPVPKVGT